VLENIDTGNISPGAATDTYLATQSSFAIGPSNNIVDFRIEQIQFPAENYAYTAIVTYSANVYESPNPQSGVLSIVQSPAGNGGTTLTGTRIATNTPQGNLYTLRATRNVAAGATQHLRVSYQVIANPTAVTLTAFNSVFQVERIKR
jgi:hypothetical protein